MLVRFTVDARDAVREKRAWWEQHRDKAPHLFRDELKTAIAHLRRAPVATMGTKRIRGPELKHMFCDYSGLIVEGLRTIRRHPTSVNCGRTSAWVSASSASFDRGSKRPTLPFTGFIAT